GLIKVRRRAVEVLGDLKPSFVLSNSFKSLSVVGFSRKLRHVPMGMHMRGWYTPDMLPAYGRRLCRKRLDALIAVSHPTRSALICSGIDPKKITVVHNPIDVDEAIRGAQLEPESPLPMRDKPVRIAVPATVYRAKGQHTAVEALPRILDAGHDAVLWLAGTVPDLEDGQRRYVQGLRETAERLGVADRLHMLGMRGDMPQVYNAATAVVLPTHAEGHPRVILEAMALAKPVAGTPAGGMTDMILPTVTGLLFDVDDAAGLAACVNHFASQPEAARAMGLRAQQYVRDNFRPDQQTERVLKLLERFAGRRAG
ncbi:MAG: glycosyltransferase family 4 protein, partial [Planctomycetota bacterium]